MTTTFSVTDLVLFLNARKVPRPEIDRIALVLINHKKGDAIAARIGTAHIESVRDFYRPVREEVLRRKRIRELVASTLSRMEGEDTATKRARLESVILAVHTLGEMSQSTR
tara:strand:- start:109 stop:441 length:333 start_codon:yes stop_codon:yes gene_type:complete